MRIAIVTLSRSDYASLRPVIRAARAESAIEVKLVAGGSHLLKRYGSSIEQIEKDGKVDAVADFLKETDDTPAELAAAYTRAVAECVRIFLKIKPERVFILGDRWEMLAVATAAAMLQLPIIHHSGGDITQGSADNQTRYALTSLAHLHLVALEEHRKRLLAIGEESWRVITTGEPALTQLSIRIPEKPQEPFVLATFHPTSFDTLPPEQQIEVFLRALHAIPERILLTAPNPDAESALFLAKLKAYAAKNPRVDLHENLGAERYYAAMATASYMIGNSSSGLWEAPSFRLPVVNIGARQQGRVHGANVIHAPLEVAAITQAIARAGAPAFRAGLTGENPYVRPDTMTLIIQSLKQPHDKAKLLAKRLVDPLHAHPGK